MNILFKSLISLLILPLAVGTVNAWKSDGGNRSNYDSSRSVKLRIEEGSFLLINGSTNVNQFQCRYDELVSDGALSVKMIYDDHCLYFEQTKLSLPVKEFFCEHKIMTKDFHNLLKADQFPEITIEVECIETHANDEIKNIPVSTDMPQAKTAAVHARFHITGRSKPYRIPVDIEQQQGRSIYRGTIMVNIEDFGLAPPKKFMGMVKVDKWIEIHLNLIVSVSGD